MKREFKLYHVCNLSDRVIFRGEDDYLVAICRLVACAYATASDIWSYAFMSTHFHLIVRTTDIVAFLRIFKINLSRWHNNKYNAGIRINVGIRELTDEGAVRVAMNYVLKNPIHHGLVDVAFKYPYSSAHIYFREYIYRDPYYSGEFSRKILQIPERLGSTMERKLFGSHKLPKKYLVQDGRLVLPENFVNVSAVCTLYKTVRNYIYNMTKPLDEEIRMFGADRDSINLRESRVSLFGKLTDIQVCGIIDEYISPKTYTQATSDEKAVLSIMLREKGVDSFQIERCL